MFNDEFIRRVLSENEINLIRFVNSCDIESRDEMENVVNQCKQLDTIEIDHQNNKCKEQIREQCKIYKRVGCSKSLFFRIYSIHRSLIGKDSNYKEISFGNKLFTRKCRWPNKKLTIFKE